jgi:hypothetical protein
LIEGNLPVIVSARMRLFSQRHMQGWRCARADLLRLAAGLPLARAAQVCARLL